jgi:hypothetical protein
MTKRTADKLIALAKPVKLHNTFYNETFEAQIVRQTRYTLYTKCGMVLDKGETILAAN